MFSSTDRVVRDILSSTGDTEARGYPMCYRQLLRSAADLKVNVYLDIRSVTVNVEDDYTIILPEDCATPLRLAAWQYGGGLRLLGRMDDKSPSYLCSSNPNPGGAETCPGQSEDTPMIGSPGVELGEYCFYNYRFPGNRYGSLYSYSTDLFENGKWRFDAQGNKLELSAGSDVYAGARMVLMYEGSVDKDAIGLIPDQWYEALRAHVLWSLYQAKNPSLAEQFRKTLRLHIHNAKLKQSRSRSGRDYIAAIKGGTNTP